MPLLRHVHELLLETGTVSSSHPQRKGRHVQNGRLVNAIWVDNFLRVVEIDGRRVRANNQLDVCREKD